MAEPESEPGVGGRDQPRALSHVTSHGVGPWGAEGSRLPSTPQGCSLEGTICQRQSHVQHLAERLEPSFSALVSGADWYLHSRNPYVGVLTPTMGLYLEAGP